MQPLPQLRPLSITVSRSFRAMRRFRLHPLCCLFLLATGCQQQMAKQPKYLPLQPSAFFPDGRSSRPLIEGTVARGQLRDDALEDAAAAPQTTQTAPSVRAAAVVGAAGNVLGAAAIAAAERQYPNRFPFTIAEADLERGRQRFDIYCAVCHDRVGTGDGKIVQRGFTRPPNFHTDLSRGFKYRGIELPLRDAPVGYFVEVMSKGFGAMPDYGSQLDPRDRWRIAAYLRVLQLSQHMKLADLPEAERKAALSALEEKR